MLRRIRRCILILLVLSKGGHLHAQQPVFKHFTTRNGLPSNETYFVYEDSKGYIWICSDGGIAKYNANQFKIFNSQNGLPDNTIFEVKEDKKGRMWFRSFSGKVGYIYNDIVHVIGASKVVSNFIKEGIVSSFTIDEEGTLLLGKQNIGRNSFLKITEPYEVNNASYDWVQDKDDCGLDIVLVGNKEVIYSDSRYVKNDGSLYMIRILDSNYKLIAKDSCRYDESTPHFYIQRSENTLFLSEDNLLRKFDLESKKVTSRTMPFAIAPFVIDNGLFLMGSFRNGVYYYKDLFRDEPLNNILKGITITGIIRDFQDGLWISSLETGVFYLGNENIMKYKVCDAGKFITHMASLPNDDLLVGLSNGDVSILHMSENGAITKEDIHSDLSDDLLYIFTSASLKDQVFISGTGSNTIYDLKSKKFKPGLPTSNDRLAIYKEIITVGKNMYASVLRDIFLIDGTSWKTEFVARVNDRISALAYDSVTKTLFVGGGKGLYKYNEGKEITERDRLFSGRIGDLKFGNGFVFAATKHTGLVVVGEQGVDTLDMAKGLVGNFCKDLCFDNGALWVSTSKGLSKVIYKGKNNYRIDNYPVEYFIDPLVTEDVCLINGRIAFFSENDVYFFSETQIKEKDRLYILPVEVNGRVFGSDRHLELPYDATDIKLKYEALFYKCNGKILYRYKIGEHWNYTNETTVNFPSLSPGDYTVEVEAMNNDRKWVKADRTFHFKVSKPLWTQAWFIIIEIILVSSILAAILYLRYKTILRKEKERNMQKLLFNELETKAIRAQMNPHFIFNALNSIQRFILENDNENAQLYLTKFSKLVRKMLESNNAEAIHLSEEIDLLNRYIEIEKLRFNQSFSYEIKAENDGLDKVFVPFMMIQPFVENAIWHGLLPKKGERFLSISFSTAGDKCIRCVVEDNGVGLSHKLEEQNPMKEKSLAIKYISQRLELLNKTKNTDCKVTITNKVALDPESSGIRVEILIPKMN